MKRILILGTIILGFLTGCLGSNGEIYVQKPASDKSIMVPAGLSATSKAIKNVFKGAGWKTFVSNVSAETTGTGGEFVNLNTKAKYPARYSVWSKSRVFDICITFDSAIKYDISIVDNVTGEEVAALTGRTCANRLEAELRKTLLPLL